MPMAYPQSTSVENIQRRVEIHKQQAEDLILQQYLGLEELDAVEAPPFPRPTRYQQQPLSRSQPTASFSTAEKLHC
jgi:hypothetical protein